MTWIVQRQTRPAGFYYFAYYATPQGKRGVTLGVLVHGLPCATLTARLREHDPSGRWSDGLVVDVCSAVDDAAVRTVLRAHRHFGGGAPTSVPKTTPAPQKAAPVALREPAHPKGHLTLSTYVWEVWADVRKAQPATWDREQWWWEQRILPALGQVRLCDLDAQKWSDFLRGLKTGGRSKGLAQTAYRVALRHAELLGWIEAIHKFAKIEGSTKRVRAEVEPMSMEEVETFLGAAPAPVHRALFATQIGQGLRPSEVIRVQWEDVDFTRGTLFVRGTKNDRARSTIPMTALTRAELLAWHKASGKPTTGPAFPMSRGAGPFREYPRSAFRTTAEKSGLNEGRGRKLFPYGCRHAFATIAATSGIDRAFTKDMMRHSRASSVLEEAYIRVSKAQTAKAFAGFGVAAQTNGEKKAS